MIPFVVVFVQHLSRHVHTLFSHVLWLASVPSCGNVSSSERVRAHRAGAFRRPIPFIRLTGLWIFVKRAGVLVVTGSRRCVTHSLNRRSSSPFDFCFRGVPVVGLWRISSAGRSASKSPTSSARRPLSRIPVFHRIRNITWRSLAYSNFCKCCLVEPSVFG